MTNYRRKKSKPKEVGRSYQVNNRITAERIRLINDAGEMLGVMSMPEAMKMADEQLMDVVLINPKAEPPVAKLIEYSKFKYQIDKAEKNKPKGGDDIKNLLVSVRIAPHDLGVQAKKADEFLGKGIKVRLQVRMRGREKSHPELAQETMGNFLSMINEQHSMETEPKLMGDSCFALLKPKK